MIYTNATCFALVRAGLVEGLGVEDIAVTHGICATRARLIVREMRAHGLLSAIYGVVSNVSS